MSLSHFSLFCFPAAYSFIFLGEKFLSPSLPHLRHSQQTGFPQKRPLGSQEQVWYVGPHTPTLSIAVLCSVILVLEGVAVIVHPSSMTDPEDVRLIMTPSSHLASTAASLTIFTIPWVSPVNLITSLLNDFEGILVCKKCKPMALGSGGKPSTHLCSIWSPGLRALIHFGSLSELLAILSIMRATLTSLGMFLAFIAFSQPSHLNLWLSVALNHWPYCWSLHTCISQPAGPQVW